MFAIEEKRIFWKKRAGEITIPFHYEKVAPAAVMEVKNNPHAWQGLEAVVCGDIAELTVTGFSAGKSVMLDFGRYVTGKLHLKLDVEEGYIHAPIRLRLMFAEHLCELAGYNGKGVLPQSWQQEEIVNIDSIDCDIEIPRRYAFNYLQIDILCTSSPVFFREIYAVATTSAIPVELAGISGNEMKKQIDDCCLKTLSNCMQTFFEDGPRRDRRLWLGDLRLQALVNSVSFRNVELVERSLYLLASQVDDEGMIPACVFENSTKLSSIKIVDYSLLLGDILFFHAREYGARDIVKELYPLALRQLELFRRYIDCDGRFHDPGGLWLFIDWSEELKREMAVSAVYVFALKQCAGLAALLGDSAEAEKLAAEAAGYTAGLRKYIGTDGIVRSKEGQISYAAQIWMIIAGVMTPEEGKKALAVLDELPDAVRPFTPYLWHHYVEACIVAGDRKRAEKILCGYWGSMIKKGARTFWEVYYPEDENFSPYLDRCQNSSCHAWSCTPSYFFRSGIAL